MDFDVTEIVKQSVFPFLVNYLPVTAITLLLTWLFVNQFFHEIFGVKGSAKSEPLEEEPPPKHEKKPPIQTTKPAKKRQQPEKWNQNTKQNYSHEWVLTSLKGHTGQILDMDFSANGKFLATCAEDRAIFIWNTKDWKDKEHKFIRYNVDLDHASFIRWSPDSKAFLYCRSVDNVIEVGKVSKRNDGWLASVSKAHTYPKMHDEDIIGMGIDVNGRYIMSCSSGKKLVLTDIKGTELGKENTYFVNNVAAKVSPCGKFIAVSGFTPDVKVWEASFNKSGEFEELTTAFSLTGHSSGVNDFAFNSDTSLVATVTKDGVWKLFDIKIEYKNSEEPHLLKTGKIETDGKKCSLALSPDGQVLALASASNLVLVNLLNGEIDKTIKNIYSGPITRILFNSTGEYILTAGEKHVRVFHNLTSYKTKIHSAKLKLNTSGLTSATRERLENIIKDCESFLKSFNKK